MKPFFLFDGAFGTYYHKKNPDCQYPELANLEDAETVGKIHLEYIDSGVNAIKTNTFGANPFVFPDRIQLKKTFKAAFESPWMLPGREQLFLPTSVPFSATALRMLIWRRQICLCRKVRQIFCLKRSILFWNCCRQSDESRRWPLIPL